MKLELKGNIDKPKMVKLLSCLIQGAEMDEIPYKTVDHDDNNWVLDAGNNWRVSFYDDHPKVMDVRYRYGKDYENSLIQWLKVRLDAKGASSDS